MDATSETFDIEEYCFVIPTRCCSSLDGSKQFVVASNGCGSHWTQVAVAVCLL
ncbi:hypothetical protein ABXV23_06905 [Vibrio owensii]|uniref:hypothetical protein n=1 Tax=Vibrio owensii TaxID=696485 RepID=UPI003398B21A